MIRAAQNDFWSNCYPFAALFSVGDCHTAQGDGEVCGIGIEAPMSVTCRFDVRTDLSIDGSQFEMTGPFTSTGRDEPMYGPSEPWQAGRSPDRWNAFIRWAATTGMDAFRTHVNRVNCQLRHADGNQFRGRGVRR